MKDNQKNVIDLDAFRKRKERAKLFTESLLADYHRQFPSMVLPIAIERRK